MSFSSDIKKSICETGYECPDCRRAELSGIFAFTGRLGDETIRYNSSSAEAVVRVTEELREEFGFDFNNSDKILIEGNNANVLRNALSEFKPVKHCCVISYIRGAFLGGGSVSDPSREYHLEFDTKSEERADGLIELLSGLDIKAKKTTRKGRSIVYVKESGNIADIIGYMSRGRAGLEIISIQIEKELKSSVVRQVNCDSANLNKLAKASSKQIAAVKKIKAAHKWQKLPDVLREIGELRLKYPDVSMEQLGHMTKQGIGKSGVNHRLNRIIEFADSLGGE